MRRRAASFLHSRCLSCWALQPPSAFITEPARRDPAMTEMIISSCKAAGEGLALKPDDNGLPFQIFPDPCDSYEGQCKLKDRLPSIVVEPTDVSEVESGELRWPPDDFLVAEQEAEGGQTCPGGRGQSQSETGGAEQKETGHSPASTRPN
ncbi:protein LBH-like [Pristis pectinata]|uniref:protein LBH-like n=1 Tax=Pristis pectinata TaxID=685728 RepID=UPI00223DC0C3|nr:protein LBH-like [Pristis pectinata]